MKYEAGTVMTDPKGYLTVEQIEKLLKAAKNKRDYALLMIMYRCGRRVSEVLAIKRNDINFLEKKIIFKILKKRTKREEIKPVDEKTIYALKDYLIDLPKNLRKKPDNLIFPISRQYVFKMVRETGERAGITTIGKKRLHPHHLRHSFAVHQVKSGNIKTVEDLRILQRYMGHTNISMTAHYLQFGQEDLKEITNFWDKVDNRNQK